MLSPGSNTLIDDKWEAFWPLSELRPLVILDYISYFILIKKLDEHQVLSEHRGDLVNNQFIYREEDAQLRWHRFKDMDAKSLFHLFTKENGIMNFIEGYGRENNLYSAYLKEPLLIPPTQQLLMNTINMVKFMGAENGDIQAEIYDYLLHKQEIAGLNGQVFAPGNIVKWLIAIMEPNNRDQVWDPSAGNGSLLVNSLKYIAHNNDPSTTNNNIVIEDNLTGIEPDPVMLRIAAVNMMLNGIENPVLENVNIFENANYSPPEQPTLILSNLFFKGSQKKILPDTNVIKADTEKIVEFLHIILKNLNTGVRAAVIIPEIILYDNGTDYLSIREQIINEQKLEAVISIPGRATSLFSGAVILILNANVTSKTWFYKMQEGTNDLGVWKKTSDKSFFAGADEIIAKNYNLNYNEYKKSATAQNFISTTDPVIINAPKEIDEIKIPKSEMPVFEKYEQALTAPAPKKRLAAITMLLAIVFAVPVLLYFYFRNQDTIRHPVTNDAAAIAVKGEEDSPPQNPKSTGILKDSARIISEPMPVNVNPGNTTISGLAKQISPRSTQSNTPIDVTEPASPSTIPERYAVIEKAYFHNQPVRNTRRNAFIVSWNNAVLKPIAEKNGFIYIVFTNQEGQTTKGWLNKNDLRQIR